MPKKIDSEMQFDMSYSGDERLTQSMRKPTFSIILEIAPGDDDKDFTSNTQLKNLFNFISDDSRIHATAVTDKLLSSKAPATTVLAKEAALHTNKPVIAVVSGKGQNKDTIAQNINKLRALGLRDIIAVTGDLLEEMAPQFRRNYFPANEYVDSVDILQAALQAGNDTNAGVAVNPFKYTGEDQYFQYIKLMRKIANGARFVVSQAGWDMKKYQELLWFLRSRDVLLPLFARVAFINSAEKDDLLSSIFPGVELPTFLSTSIARELGNRENFLNIQAERTALIAAGCRLMGYSGILLTGINTSYELENFLDKFETELALFKTYGEWAVEWNKRVKNFSCVSFHPTFADTPPFYLYNSLLHPKLRDFSPEHASPALPNFQSPAIADIVQSKLAAPGTPQWIKKTVKHLTKQNEDNDDIKNQCLGLDNSTCPKKLCHGPCGGSKQDGTCEDGKAPCFFHRVLRLAVWNKQIDFLEGK